MDDRWKYDDLLSVLVPRWIQVQIHLFKKLIHATQMGKNERPCWIRCVQTVRTRSALE